MNPIRSIAITFFTISTAGFFTSELKDCYECAATNGGNAWMCDNYGEQKTGKRVCCVDTNEI